MPWRGPEFPGEFPTLGYQVAEFVQAKVVVPDREAAGEPFVLSDDQLRFFLHLYRLDPETGKFVYPRGGQVVAPQKWGKGPFTSAWIIAEAHQEGPVRFAGWDAAGEPVGKPVPTPWIQVTASAEDQTANIWEALVPMITLGDLKAEIPDTGKTRIYLPGGGRIEPVTSKGGTRRGQRITAAAQDETSDWTDSSGGQKLADTQRRNLAGTGGRFLDTCNAWDPADESVAERTFKQGAKHGVYCWMPGPGPGSIRNKADRRRMIRKVYGSHLLPQGWVDPDRIEGEILALLDRDPAQAERFFINRPFSAEGAAFIEEKLIAAVRSGRRPEPGSTITIGVDGARFRDALAIVACDGETGHKWPLKIIERPPKAKQGYQHDFEAADGAMIAAFEEYHVWRVYIDPQNIGRLVDRWQGRWTDDVVIEWVTSRPKPYGFLVKNYTESLHAGDFTIDDDPTFLQHHRNARTVKTTAQDDKGRPLKIWAKDSQDSPRVIDAVPAAGLAEEARGDWIAADKPGPENEDQSFYTYAS